MRRTQRPQRVVNLADKFAAIQIPIDSVIISIDPGVIHFGVAVFQPDDHHQTFIQTTRINLLTHMENATAFRQIKQATYLGRIGGRILFHLHRYLLSVLKCDINLPLYLIIEKNDLLLTEEMAGLIMGMCLVWFNHIGPKFREKYTVSPMPFKSWLGLPRDVNRYMKKRAVLNAVCTRIGETQPRQLSFDEADAVANALFIFDKYKDDFIFSNETSGTFQQHALLDCQVPQWPEQGHDRVELRQPRPMQLPYPLLSSHGLGQFLSALHSPPESADESPLGQHPFDDLSLVNPFHSGGDGRRQSPDSDV